MYRYGLSRDAFNNVIGSKIQEAINIAQQVINDVHNQKFEINKVLLIGGSSQLTLIKELFASLLPNASIETCGEKDIAVALGNNYVRIDDSQDVLSQSEDTEEFTNDLPLNMSKSIKCKNPVCGSDKCYKIIGRLGYHCIDCGWEGVNVIVTYEN